ncbi:MAG: META domain-containing protein [Minisyncoccia bacterium]
MHSKRTIVIIIIIIFGACVYFSYTKNENELLLTPKTPISQTASDPKNATYVIDGTNVTLVNGLSELEVIPDSASRVITQYFGNEVKHDLNDDGREDVAFLLTQETGGSGVFFYVVAALNTPTGYVGSKAFFLGDRIAPQTTVMDEGKTTIGTYRQNVIVVNYAVRRPNEPFTTSPSIGKSVWLKLDPVTMQFGEVAQNFEGEADPAKMTLNMKTWDWINTLYNNDKEIKPILPKRFTLTFRSDGTFSATTDCNNTSGEYVVNGSKISFTKMMSTMMYCNEASQESDFTGMLGEIQSYHFTSKGELIFNLKFDSGVMIFK